MTSYSNVGLTGNVKRGCLCGSKNRRKSLDRMGGGLYISDIEAILTCYTNTLTGQCEDRLNVFKALISGAGDLRFLGPDEQIKYNC